MVNRYAPPSSPEELLRWVQERMAASRRKREEMYESARLEQMVNVAAANPQAPPREVVNPQIPNTAPVQPQLELPTPPSEVNTRGLDIGGFWGSGVIENVASGAMSLSETAGGAVANLATKVMPGEQEFEKNLQQVRNESPDIPGWGLPQRGSMVAEAFRRTNFPTLDLPGGGFDVIPGKGEWRLLDTVGVKGALELTPDALLAIATGGTSLAGNIAKGSLRGTAASAGKIAAETVGIDLPYKIGAAGLRWTDQALLNVSKAGGTWRGMTGMVPGYTADSVKLSRAGAVEKLMTEGGTDITALVPVSQAGAGDSLLRESLERSKGYYETGQKGPLRSALEWSLGWQKVFDASKVADRAFLIHAADTDQAPGLIAPIRAAVINRWKAASFLQNDKGELLVGVAPGAKRRVNPVTEQWDTVDGVSRRPKKTTTAGEPLQPGYDPDIGTPPDPDTFYGGATTGRTKYPEYPDRDIRVESTNVPNKNRLTGDVGPSGEYQTVSLQLSQVFEDLFDTGMRKATGTIKDLTKLAGKSYENAFNTLTKQGHKLEPDVVLYRNDKYGYIVTQQQAEYVQWVHNLIEDSRGLMQMNNVDFGKTILEGAGSNWTPRRVIGGLLKEARSVSKGGRATAGATQQFQRARSLSYVGQAIEDGVSAGFEYESNIGNLMEAYFTGVYRAIRDQKLSDQMSLLVIRRQELVDANLLPAEYIRGLKDAPPAFQGKLFGKEVADKLEKYISQPHPFLRTVGTVGDISRTARASTDFSAPFIQGIILLARDPKKWATGIPKMFKAFASENYYNQWFEGNLQRIMNAVDDQVVINGRSEFFAGLEPLQKAVRKVPIAGDFVAKRFNQFERAFTFYGDYARLEMYDALIPVAKRSGDANAVKDVVDFVNKATGVFRPGALVQSPSQQHLERMFLFFAPRYTRASLSLAADILRGGTRGQLARSSLTRLAMGGLATYWMTAQALGQKPNLDPTDPGFMRVSINGDNIGVGTVWMSLVKLAADILADPAFEGKVDESQLLAQRGQFGERDLSTRIQDNHLVRWVRSRTSIITGASIDIFNGHDFLGNPLDTGVDRFKHIATQALPFALEDAFMGQPHNSSYLGTAASLAGLSAFPQSLSSRVRDMQDTYAMAEYGKPWKKLNKLEQNRLRTANYELESLIEEARRDRVNRGTELNTLTQEWFDRTEDINNAYNESVSYAYEYLMANPGTQDLVTFRRETLKTFGTRRREQLKALYTEKRLGPVVEWFEETQKKRSVGESSERPEDVAYYQYLDQVAFAPELELPSGEFDFDTQRTRELQFKQEWGEEVYDYVKTLLRDGKVIHPIVDELNKGRVRFQHYWGTPDNENSAVGAVIAARPDPILAKELYMAWARASKPVADEMLKTNSELRRITKDINDVRVALRRKDPEMDVFLTRWGYVSRPVSPENKFEGALDIIYDTRPMPYVGGEPSYFISGSRMADPY